MLDPTTRSFLLPIASIFLTLLIKVMSRRDGNTKLSRNDLAVGFNLMIAACVVLLNVLFKAWDQQAETIAPQGPYANTEVVISSLLLCGYFVLAIFTSLIVRLYGWEKEEPTSLNILFGIIIPDIVGVAMLIFAANFQI